MTVTSNISSVTSTPNKTTTASKNISTDDFLKILVSEMQNQDPSNPMDDTQVVAQMAQFNTLEQMQNMNKTLESMTIAQSATLIGKSAEAEVNGSPISGKVDSIFVKDSVPYAQIGEDSVPVSSITKIY
jgi:flagellar basal-body rod modification protein FlgD